jgi:hypothetical protein
MAGHGYNLRDGIRYLGNFQYSVKLFNGSAWVDQHVYFDGELRATDPTVNTEGESWTILFQRAYLDIYGGGFRFPENAIRSLTGRVPDILNAPVAAPDSARIEAALANRAPVVAATPETDDPFNPITAGLRLNHSYTVLAVSRNADGTPNMVVVRDPALGNYISLTWAEFTHSMVAVWV